jgi:hypothetical protein
MLQLILGGMKIRSMCFEYLIFLDSFNFPSISLKSMPKSFDLTCKKMYYPHFLSRSRTRLIWALISNLSIWGQTISGYKRAHILNSTSR